MRAKRMSSSHEEGPNSRIVDPNDTKWLEHCDVLTTHNLSSI